MESGWLYWARFDGEGSSSIIAIEEETKQVVVRGTFDELAWPVVGLYSSKAGALDIDRTGDFDLTVAAAAVESEQFTTKAAALPEASLTVPER